MLGKERLQCFEIVPRKQHDVLVGLARLATRLGPLGVLLRKAAPVVAGVGANEDAVLPAVVMALELDDQGAVSRRSGQAKSQRHRLCPCHQEADSVGAGDDAADELSKLELAGVLSGEELTIGE